MIHVDYLMIPEILAYCFNTGLKISLLFWVGGGGWVGGWVGEINNIDHLSPVKTETRTELGNREASE